MPEYTLGKADTFLKDGEMRRVDLDGSSVLLSRVNGQYHATAGDCTHYGAHLDQGVLKGHIVMCPLHHACFDVRTGTRLEPPALNDLPDYMVNIQEGNVVVTLPNSNQTEPQGKADASDGRTFVIVGGGAAGNAAAEELRRSGYRGKIVMISDVPDIPLDRPNLSKDYLAGKADPAWMPLRPDAAWYADRDIDLRLNTQVTSINPKAHQIVIGAGQTIAYNALLLATGGTPRTLAIPGADLSGVFLLRKMADADRVIEAAAKSQRRLAAIIGASFIGMEAAAALAEGRGMSVTVIGIETVPFGHIWGDDIGKMLQKEHEDHGVQFRLGAQIKQLVSKDGAVTGVELASGEVVLADFVLMGVGVQPATDFLSGSGLKLDEKDKSVRVDTRLLTSEPNIFAAGDIARWENDGKRGSIRIEHWRIAEQQGMVAARNMLGGTESIAQRVPFFWTHQWSIELRYVGHAEKWDEIIYRGTPAQKQFIAFYMGGGKLLAAAACDHDADLDAIEFILRDGMRPTTEQMRDPAFDLVRYASGNG